jgi:hypothetical protein
VPSLVFADGGTIRLSEQTGKYRITVFTAPEVVRAGPVDISVLVQEASTGELATGVEVTIGAQYRGAQGVTLQHVATTEAATNKLYRVATLNLPNSGLWTVDVVVAGALGKARVSFDLHAAAPLPEWLAMWPWVGWPALAIVLFGIHLLLVRLKTKGSTHAPRLFKAL